MLRFRFSDGGLLRQAGGYATRGYYNSEIWDSCVLGYALFEGHLIEVKEIPNTVTRSCNANSGWGSEEVKETFFTHRV
jgi:hypothetical protein